MLLLIFDFCLWLSRSFQTLEGRREKVRPTAAVAVLNTQYNGTNRAGSVQKTEMGIIVSPLILAHHGEDTSQAAYRTGHGAELREDALVPGDDFSCLLSPEVDAQET